MRLTADVGRRAPPFTPHGPQIGFTRDPDPSGRARNGVYSMVRPSHRSQAYVVVGTLLLLLPQQVSNDDVRGTLTAWNKIIWMLRARLR